MIRWVKWFFVIIECQLFDVCWFSIISNNPVIQHELFTQFICKFILYTYLFLVDSLLFLQSTPFFVKILMYFSATIKWWKFHLLQSLLLCEFFLIWFYLFVIIFFLNIFVLMINHFYSCDFTSLLGPGWGSRDKYSVV